MTKYWKFVESLIQANGGTYVADKKPTYADFVVMASVQGIQKGFWDHIDTNFFDDYPGVSATTKAMEENDAVKKYNESKK